jgi:hypothetical protein
LFGACVAALVAACSKDSDPNLPVVSDNAQALCDRLFSCCTPSELEGFRFVDDHTPPTHDGCIAFHTNNGTSDLTTNAAEVAAGRIAVHLDRSSGCIATLQAASCAEFYARLVHLHVGDAFSLCNSVIVEPLVSNGGKCKVYLDCQSGYCEIPASATPDAGGAGGTCKPAPKANEPCTSECGDGLRCDPTTALCQPLAPAGGDCTTPEACKSGACQSGKCVSPGKCGG